MQAKAIEILISMLVKMFDQELMRELAEEIVNWVEERVTGSASSIDDMVVLPLVAAVRAAFGLAKPIE